MRWIALSMLVVVSGCTSVTNSFAVEDDRSEVSQATLLLCGANVPLRRTGELFFINYAIRCEGDGQVALTYTSGEQYNCLVGYVTQGAVQHFRFRATTKGCLTVTR